MKLPAASQPRFCLQSKMTDSFIDIREERFMRILWGEGAGKVEEIWSGGSHTHDWAKEQVIYNIWEPHQDAFHRKLGHYSAQTCNRQYMENSLQSWVYALQRTPTSTTKDF
ncbi:MAG: hypothetical protein J3R72DRAFT_521333 [Linnemannia gamsii]|nr:MAG: hypothetical protein J3R72DRAFT_521333 [Linnemannia gamsii]